MQEQDDGPSDPAKVAVTISAALAAGMVKFPDAAAELRFRAKLDELSESVKRSSEAIAALPVPPAVTHSNRPEVEVLIAGRHDLMIEVDRVSHLLVKISEAFPNPRWVVDDETARPAEIAQLLDRLGAYIVGQDERLIAAGDALAEANRMVDTAQAHTSEAIRLAQEAQSERDAAVVDRDKADAARGKAERDHSAILKGLRAGFEQFKAEQRAEVEGLKGDVRSAKEAANEERELREDAESGQKWLEQQIARERNRSSALEMRIEGAIFALRHGMNEGREVSEARFSPSESLINYLAAAISDIGGKPRYRVVTSPRFYGLSKEIAAEVKLEQWQHEHGFHVRRIERLELIETIAAALGMRKAAR